jgi:hypothetical protein
MAYDQTTIELFIDQRAEGASLDTIARELQIAKRTLIAWNHQFKNQIDTLKALRLEALQEKYQVFREKRIELFGQKLQTVLHELEFRDLHAVPTPKLFDLLLKYSSALKREEHPLDLEPTANDEENLDTDSPMGTKTAPEFHQMKITEPVQDA